MTEEYFIKQGKYYYNIHGWSDKHLNQATAFNSYEEALNVAKEKLSGYFSIEKHFYNI